MIAQQPQQGLYLITEELLRNYRFGTATFEDIEDYARSHPYQSEQDGLEKLLNFHKQYSRKALYTNGFIIDEIEEELRQRAGDMSE